MGNTARRSSRAASSGAPHSAGKGRNRKQIAAGGGGAKDRVIARSRAGAPAHNLFRIASSQGKQSAENFSRHELDERLSRLRSADPGLALALDWAAALAEDEERTILGLYHGRGSLRSRKAGKPRRGRPSSSARDDPAAVLAGIEGKPFRALSKVQREIAGRIGVEVRRRGRAPLYVARIAEAVLRARRAGHPITEYPRQGRESAYDVVGREFHLAAESVAVIWKQWRRENRGARTIRI